MVDYVLTSSRIWSVWRVEGECTIYSAQLTTKDARCYNWVPVLLEPLPDVNQPPEDSSDKDPRQLYLQHIFQPGSFPIHVIQKALSVSLLTAFILFMSFFFYVIMFFRFTNVQTF